MSLSDDCLPNFYFKIHLFLLQKLEQVKYCSAEMINIFLITEITIIYDSTEITIIYHTITYVFDPQSIHRSFMHPLSTPLLLLPPPTIAPCTRSVLENFKDDERVHVNPEDGADEEKRDDENNRSNVVGRVISIRQTGSNFVPTSKRGHL